MELDAEKVRSMLACFCSVEDVCKAYRTDRESLDAFCKDSFSMGLDEAAETFAAQGRAMVHKAQVEAAMDGNNSMLILLGKQYLGQSDDPKLAEREEKETPLGNVLKLYDGAKDRKQGAAR